MSAPLLWELLKKHNSFVGARVKGMTFSKEAGNLMNKHSYKYSGLANAKNVTVEADGEAVKFAVGRVKTANQPKKAKYTCTIKSDGRKVNTAVGKQVASYRPDLKAAAVARASAVHKALRVKKAKK